MGLPGFPTPIAIAGLGAVAFLLMDLAVRFGREARRIDAAPADRGTTQVAYRAFLVIVLAVFVLPRFAHPARLEVPLAPAVAWTGAAMIPIGLLLRLWATLTLRHAYTRTLRIQPGQELIRRGPYRWVRHPGYLGSLVMWSGVGLASANLLSIAIVFAALAIAYGRRIHHEEAMLRAAFGDRHRAYRAEVGLLLPRLIRRPEPRSDGV